MKMEHKIDRTGVLLLHKRDRNFIPQEPTNIIFVHCSNKEKKFFFRCIVKKKKKRYRNFLSLKYTEKRKF